MNIALFFTRGISLKLWLDKGLFYREKLIYEALLNEGTVKKVVWFTYGENDLNIYYDLVRDGVLDSRIILIPMPRFFRYVPFGSFFYSFLLPVLNIGIFQDLDLLRTNQTDGSWTAVLSKLIYSKKLVYRTGYTISQLENGIKRYGILIRKLIEFCEFVSYKFSDRAIVSSEHSLHYVTSKYSLDESKIDVIRNFVDVNKFSDNADSRENRITYVGRLSIEKNVSSLLEACSLADIPIDLYGSGPLREELKLLASNLGVEARFFGNVSNDDLPKILNRSKYFALVSFSEGMPKSLIEAMASGCICIGTNVSGINEIITCDNGFIASNTSKESIYKAILQATNSDEEYLSIIKAKSKERILKDFSLESIIKKEVEMIQKVMR